MSNNQSSCEGQPVFRFRKNQPVVWWHKKLEKSNQLCFYCGRFIGDGAIPSDKEHLIGRCFGPAGAFTTGQEFNFIFRGCCKCNRYKADIERHLSTVTIFNSPARAINGTVNASALNKAQKDVHPLEEKPVCDSSKEMTATFNSGPLQIKFRLTAPPQAIPEYVRELALSHIQGLFTLITTANPLDRPTTRLLPECQFQLFGYFNDDDWGNVQLLEVYRRAALIPRVAIIETANGFFKAVMRATDDERREWFWALEWNKSMRVFGGITGGEIPIIFSNLPEFEWRQIAADARMRTNVPLDAEHDILFRDWISDTQQPNDCPPHNPPNRCR